MLSFTENIQMSRGPITKLGAEIAHKETIAAILSIGLPSCKLLIIPMIIDKITEKINETLASFTVTRKRG